MSATLNPETLDMLRALEADDPGSLGRLIGMFVADTPGLLSRIDAARQKRDPEELKNAAHYLRSAALALGADDLAQAAHQVEHLTPDRIQGAESDALVATLHGRLREAVQSLMQVSGQAA